MARFRNLPFEIEAIRWNGYSNNLGLTNGLEYPDARFDYPEWMPPCTNVVPDDKLSATIPVGQIWRHREALLIGTLEGTMRAEPGDWIIRSVKGELYPCKPDIFAATYERVPALGDLSTQKGRADDR
jgi:hypothetical protein